MGDLELASEKYWESAEIDIRLNPRRDLDVCGLREFLREECEVRHAVVMATSGSSGVPKFVILPKEAILASAKAVNDYCQITADDIWLAGLSNFHVGGIGVYARAHLSGSRIETIVEERWDRSGNALVHAIAEKGVTLTSLTPTHLYDIVSSELAAPQSLRGIFLGGGMISPDLVASGKELGWPLWPTYGMTEACSQIATSIEGDSEWLPILPHWEIKVGENDRLAIRGRALFGGYAMLTPKGWDYVGAQNADGWFVTGDCCSVREGRLRFHSRLDDLVKISGELFSLSDLNERAMAVARVHGSEAAIVARPDPRRETELVMFVAGDRLFAEKVMSAFNDSVASLEAARRLVSVPELPRTEIGKIDRRALADLL